MEKDYNISILADIYGELLTAKQLEAVKLYYNLDNSLAEIAEQLGISRQSVRGSILSATNALNELEGKLKIKEKLEKIEKEVEFGIENNQNGDSDSVGKAFENIRRILEET